MGGCAFKKSHLRVLACALVACLVAGSFFDLAISTAVFDPSAPFGRFVEAFGFAPALVLVSVVGVTLLRCVECGRRRSYGWGALAIVCLVVVVALLVGTSGTYEYSPQATAATVAGIVVVNVLVLRATRGAARPDMARWALFALLALVTQEILVNGVIKLAWPRPRMRGIAVVPELSFQPWWDGGVEGRLELIARGVDKDLFKSFPSGHTAAAASLLALAALPFSGAHAERSRTGAFWCAVAYTVLIASARILAGAHFLTDVTCGFAVQVLMLLAADALVLRHGAPKGDSREP